MRALILVAGAALSLSACGGNSQTNEANTLATDNMMTDQNMTVDSNMMMDSNMSNMGMDTNVTGGMDANMATNAATESNMMAQDRNTNDPDSNIANGM